jgi:hypothetical protein
MVSCTAIRSAVIAAPAGMLTCRRAFPAGDLFPQHRRCGLIEEWK